MTQILTTPLTTQKRVVGNLEPIGAQIIDQNGDEVDLTALTILFRMILISDGSVKVDDEAASIVDATTGRVEYSPAAADMNTAGKYAIYFIDDAAVDRRMPYDGARYQLDVILENET